MTLHSARPAISMCGICCTLGFEPDPDPDPDPDHIGLVKPPALECTGRQLPVGRARQAVNRVNLGIWGRMLAVSG
jgi:hypothetical protein